MSYHDILRVSLYPENLQITNINVLLFPLLIYEEESIYVFVVGSVVIPTVLNLWILQIF